MAGLIMMFRFQSRLGRKKLFCKSFQSAPGTPCTKRARAKFDWNECDCLDGENHSEFRSIGRLRDKAELTSAFSGIHADNVTTNLGLLQFRFLPPPWHYALRLLRNAVKILGVSHHSLHASNIPERWTTALVTLVIVSLFWFGYDCQWGRLYASSPYHRLQVEALLNGQLSLSSSIERLDHGLAWYDSQVNQVWGLGVAMWMVPFELACRLFGVAPCPDRLPLLAAVALLGWYGSRGGAAVGKVLRSRIAGFSFVYLVLLYPPLWILILGSRVIYEQTILYACLLSMALFIAVVRFLLLQRPVDFWIVCVLGGLSGLVRITHGVYGMTAGLVCGCVLLVSAISRNKVHRITGDWRKIGQLLAGWTVLLGGFAFLAYSNGIRFGSVLEGGHRLTNHTMDVIYLTRFENPFEEAGLVDASKELFSWIFLSPFHGYGMDGSHSIPWQALAYRWRGGSQLTFDPSFLLVAVGSCLVAAICLSRRIRRRGWCLGCLCHPRKPLQCLVLGMFVWFIVNAFAVAGFYLYSPIVTTRYILDFAPSFLAPFVMALLLVRRWPRLMPALFAVWLPCELMTVWLSHGNTSVRAEIPKAELKSLPMADGRKLASFNGRYTLANHPLETSLHYNGQGWDRDGMASSIVTLMLDGPQFLEISVGQRTEGSAHDSYRAKMGNIELPTESVIRTTEGSNWVAKVRFSIPKRIRPQDKVQLIFVCFTTDWEQTTRRSQRPLYEVQWKQ
jgi:hypothetical protein